jgi:predicted enzyme related to lactoylglutathione lyase
VKDIERAKRFYLTEPSLGVFVVNYQLPGQDEVSQFEITAAHVGGFVADGAAMAFRARENAE